MRKVKFTYISILILSILSFYWLAHAYNLPKFFHFNKKTALKEWEEKIFKNKVLYEIKTKWGKATYLLKATRPVQA